MTGAKGKARERAARSVPTKSPTVRSADVPRPVVCGIYMLFQAHELVYVGRSVDCYARIAEHRAKGRPFDHATVTACMPEDAAWIEAALVRALEPSQNRNLRSAPHLVQVSTPADPRVVVNLGAAQKHAAAFGIKVETFRRAVGAGDLVFHRDHPTHGARRITMGALNGWCEKVLAARR